jgi:hypothetical protein
MSTGCLCEETPRRDLRIGLIERTIDRIEPKAREILGRDSGAGLNSATLSGATTWVITNYSVYFSEDGSVMSVLHLHPDVASLEFHVQVAGDKFPPIAPLIHMRSIELFGRPGDELVGLFRAKAKLLGTGKVIVHDLHAGFARLGQG